MSDGFFHWTARVTYATDDFDGVNDRVDLLDAHEDTAANLPGPLELNRESASASTGKVVIPASGKGHRLAADPFGFADGAMAAVAVTRRYADVLGLGAPIAVEVTHAG